MFPFLFEHTGENDSTVTLEGERSDLIDNNVVHMLGL